MGHGAAHGLGTRAGGDPLIFLIGALAAPAVGPFLYRWLHDQPVAVRLVDNFVYVAVPALVAWHVLPFAWEQRSAAAIVAVAVGFILPAGIERVSRLLAPVTDDLAMVVGISGLVLHAFLEGAAIAPTAGVAPEASLGLAVILHRIPIGLVIWWLIRPRHGAGLAALGIASIMFATVGGAALAGQLVGDAHGVGIELYQAFVSGSLVHVVFHQGRHDHAHDDIGGHGH